MSSNISTHKLSTPIICISHRVACRYIKCTFVAKCLQKVAVVLTWSVHWKQNRLKNRVILDCTYWNTFISLPFADIHRSFVLDWRPIQGIFFHSPGLIINCIGWVVLLKQCPLALKACSHWTGHISRGVWIILSHFCSSKTVSISIRISVSWILPNLLNAL